MKNYIKKPLKSSNGITLIALVITIIVLLILAGISISMVLGENGILQRARDAKTKSDEAQIRERIQLAYHSALTKDILGKDGELTMTTLQTELDNEFTGKTVNITPNIDKNEWIIKVDNVEEKIIAGKDNAVKLIGSEYDKGNIKVGDRLTYSANNVENWIVFGKDNNGNVLLTTETPVGSFRSTWRKSIMVYLGR